MADIHIYSPLCIAAGAIFPPICAALVGLRFYARRQQGTSVGWDDWLTIPALVLVIGMCVAILIGVARHSVGFKAPPKKPGETSLTASSYEQSTVRSILWSVELMQIPALTAVKLSFVLFYRRVFNQGAEAWFRIVSITIMALIGLWCIGYFFAFIALCPGHPALYWSTLKQQQKACVDTVMLHNSYGISDVILDFFVLLLPLPPVLRLQMSSSRKLAVIGLFGLGIFSVIASIIRMITYLQSTAAEFKPETDTNILITGGIYWSVVECSVALISCCLPTAHSVFRRKIVATFRSSSSKQSSGPFKDTLSRSMPRRSGYRRRLDSDSSDVELAGFSTSARGDAEDATIGTAKPAENQIFIQQTMETLHTRQQ